MNYDNQLQPEQFPGAYITPEVSRRMENVHRLANLTAQALNNMEQGEALHTDRSLFSNRLPVGPTLIPHKIIIPDDIDGKLVGISSQAQNINALRQKAQEEASKLDRSSIIEHLGLKKNLNEFPIQYEDLERRA